MHNNTPKRRGHGPMAVAEKAKDFKGTLKKFHNALNRLRRIKHENLYG